MQVDFHTYVTSVSFEKYKYRCHMCVCVCEYLTNIMTDMAFFSTNTRSKRSWKTKTFVAFVFQWALSLSWFSVNCVAVSDRGARQSKHSLEKRREASSGSVVMPLSPSSNIIILSWLLLFRQVPGWQQASKLCRSSTCRERTTASTSASLPGQPISLHRFVVKVVLIDIANRHCEKKSIMHGQ